MLTKEAVAVWDMSIEQIKWRRVWNVMSKTISLPSFSYSRKELFVLKPRWPTAVCRETMACRCLQQRVLIY